MPTLIFDGIAYGMLLFVLALGLAVTMGLMNFINLVNTSLPIMKGFSQNFILFTHWFIGST